MDDASAVNHVNGRDRVVWTRQSPATIFNALQGNNSPPSSSSSRRDQELLLKTLEGKGSHNNENRPTAEWMQAIPAASPQHKPSTETNAATAAERPRKRRSIPPFPKAMLATAQPATTSASAEHSSADTAAGAGASTSIVTAATNTSEDDDFGSELDANWSQEFEDLVASIESSQTPVSMSAPSPRTTLTPRRRELRPRPTTTSQSPRDRLPPLAANTSPTAATRRPPLSLIEMKRDEAMRKLQSKRTAQQQQQPQPPQKR